MSRRLVRVGPTAVGAALGVALLGPTTAAAATCSDYPNQAAAQRAADTRDADGDGTYCESLPCPCQRAGAGSPRPKSRPVSRPQPRPRPARRAQRIDARIIEVIDGDTVRVSARGARRSSYTVRLIGIDTPETRKPATPVECGGKEATANMLRLSFSDPEDSDGDGLLDREGGQGGRVTLTTDPSQDTFDRYRRLLAYVQTRGGEQLNVEQVAAGWAETYVYNDKPFRQVDRFRAAERQARGARRGVWGSCEGDFHSAPRATSRPPAASINSAAVTLPSRCFNQAVRPRTVILTCADAGFSAVSLSWRTWGGHRATASGVALLNNCEPDCARGTYERFALRLSAVRARSCPGARRQYTLVRYSFTGDNPFPPGSHGRRRPTVPFPCPAR